VAKAADWVREGSGVSKDSAGPAVRAGSGWEADQEASARADTVITIMAIMAEVVVRVDLEALAVVQGDLAVLAADSAAVSMEDMDGTEEDTMEDTIEQMVYRFGEEDATCIPGPYTLLKL